MGEEEADTRGGRKKKSLGRMKKILTTMRYYCTPIRMTKILKQQNKKLLTVSSTDQGADTDGTYAYQLT